MGISIAMCISIAWAFRLAICISIAMGWLWVFRLLWASYEYFDCALPWLFWLLWAGYDL
jgi:hypothetical protein